MGHCHSKKHKKNKHRKEEIVTTTGPSINRVLTTTGANGMQVNTTADYLQQANKLAEPDPVKKLNEVTVVVQETDHHEHHPTKTVSSKTYREEIDSFKKSTPFMPHNYNKLSNDDLIFYNHLINAKKLEISFYEEPIQNLQELIFFLERPVTFAPTYEEDPEFRKLYIAWTFFQWVIRNLSNNNSIPLNSPEGTTIEGDVFLQKSGNSFEIANLLNNVLTYFSIECLVIPGHLRRENQCLEEINHCWNAVKLYGKYRLIDCSSAGLNSPYLDTKMTRIHFPEFFFCAVPHHLIYTHYPQDLSHTFVEHGGLLLDREHYSQISQLKCNMLIYGFQLFEYKNMFIDAKEAYMKSNTNEIHLSFCAFEDIHVNMRLNFQNVNLEESFNLFYIQKRRFDKELDKHKTNVTDYYFLYKDMLERSAEGIDYNDDKLMVYDVSLKLPKRDLYNLEVYADKKRETDVVDVLNFDYCFTYKIDANFEGFIEVADLESLKYPVTSDTFLDRHCSIIEPRNYHLGKYFNTQSDIIFRFRLPGATNAVISLDSKGEFIQLTKEGIDTWSYVHSHQIPFKDVMIAGCFDNINNTTEEESPQYYSLVAYTF